MVFSPFIYIIFFLFQFIEDLFRCYQLAVINQFFKSLPEPGHDIRRKTANPCIEDSACIDAVFQNSPPNLTGFDIILSSTLGRCFNLISR